MQTGFGLLDILVSEVTMVVGAVVFLVCGILLILKRKALSSPQIGLTAAAMVVSGIYLAFIIWLVVMWG